MNNIENKNLDLFDALVMAYHKRHPRAESPLNFVEWLGVGKMIEILSKAKELDAEAKIMLDYASPFEPILKEVRYVTRRKKEKKMLPSDGLPLQNIA